MNHAKLLIFPDHSIFIAQIKYIVPDEIGGHDLALYEPFEVQLKPKLSVISEGVIENDVKAHSYYRLTPWLLDFTTQSRYELHSDKLLTIAEPNPQLLHEYKNALTQNLK